MLYAVVVTEPTLPVAKTPVTSTPAPAWPCIVPTDIVPTTPGYGERSVCGYSCRANRPRTFNTFNVCIWAGIGCTNLPCSSSTCNRQTASVTTEL